MKTRGYLACLLLLITLSAAATPAQIIRHIRTFPGVEIFDTARIALERIVSEDSVAAASFSLGTHSRVVSPASPVTFSDGDSLTIVSAHSYGLTHTTVDTLWITTCCGRRLVAVYVNSGGIAELSAPLTSQFLYTEEGRTETIYIQIDNRTQFDAQIDSFNFSGASGFAFAEAPSLPFLLPAHDSQYLQIDFRSMKQGIYKGTLAVHTSTPPFYLSPYLEFDFTAQVAPAMQKSVNMIDGRVAALRPNPAIDFIIVPSEGSNAEVRLIDAVGREFYPRRVERSGQFVLDVSAVPVGTYILAHGLARMRVAIVR